MKPIKIDLSENLKEIEIVPIADVKKMRATL